MYSATCGSTFDGSASDTIDRSTEPCIFVFQFETDRLQVKETGVAKHCPNPDCVGLARDGCVAEYDDRLVRCLDCDARLVAGPSQPDHELGLEFNDLRTVFIAASVVQGHLVAGTIEAEGIPVYLKGEMLQGAVGELSADVRQVEVQVPVERAERARQIAMRFEGPLDPESGHARLLPRRILAERDGPIRSA